MTTRDDPERIRTILSKINSLLPKDDIVAESKMLGISISWHNRDDIAYLSHEIDKYSSKERLPLNKRRLIEDLFSQASILHVMFDSIDARWKYIHTAYRLVKRGDVFRSKRFIRIILGPNRRELPSLLNVLSQYKEIAKANHVLNKHAIDILEEMLHETDESPPLNQQVDNLSIAIEKLEQQISSYHGHLH